MRKVYNKLVRDKIIDIIEADNKTPGYRVVDKGECQELLVKKLQEEVDEFLEERELIELADILEVIQAYAELSGLSWEQLMDMKEKKAERRGGFKKRFLLEWVEE